MVTYTVREGQNLFDVALQLYGDCQYLVQVCQDNNLSLDSDLFGGQQIAYNNSVFNQNTSTLYLALTGVDIVSTDLEAAPDIIEHSASEYEALEHN